VSTAATVAWPRRGKLFETHPARDKSLSQVISTDHADFAAV